MKKCINCEYWRADDKSDVVGTGFCFVKPPTLIMVPVETLQGQALGARSVRPQTKASDFCREFSPLNKVIQ